MMRRSPVPSVTIVVPYFQQPADLDRLCAGLDVQSRAGFEVVVADDGSLHAPAPRFASGAPVRLVRQDDQGFRAGAARNLGVAATTGDMLVFLDADMVPEPAFVESLVRCVQQGPDVVAVGRRRHADLAGWTPAQVRSWLADDGPAPEPLPEPAWLRDGYAATRNLADADGRSFRYVISAVMACERALFDDLGGFDDRFVGYGGEDWDFAYRAYNNGATLAHEPAAVAWHNGPDWSGRPDPRAAATKRAEAARLAQLIPEPGTRGSVAAPDIPDVLVDFNFSAAADLHDCIRALLAQTCSDLAVRVPPGTASGLGGLPNRVSERVWTTDQLRRARMRFTLHEPVSLRPDAVTRLTELLAPPGNGPVRVTSDGRLLLEAWSTRELGRRRRWGAPNTSVSAGLCGATLRPDEIVAGSTVGVCGG